MVIFKIGGISAGIAFILSLVVGLLSGSGILVLLVRALIFGILFFALSCLIYWLTAQFLPELLSGSEDDLGFSVSGSRVDISVGDGPIVGAFPTDNSELVDDIAGRPSTQARNTSLPLDQKQNAGYTDDGGMDGDLEFAGSSLSEDRAASEKPGITGNQEILPDMDSFTDIPGSTSDLINTDSFAYDSREPRKPLSASKKSEMGGDFNPKELAQAIQTVLKREEKD